MGEVRCALPADPAEARVIDADVPAAVGRVLDEVLGDRVARARAMDALFAEELAGRVARFTRAGGKRLRSQLLWWTFRACGGSGEGPVAAAVRIGAALELLQTCALVHDDVMDGSALRRGRPALHADLRTRYAGSASPGRVARFAEAGGLLAGDLALAWSDDLMAETPLDPATGRTVRRLWSDLRTEMVAGQYLEVQGQITGSSSLSRALRAARLKSGRYSVERPLALGAALAGADDATTRALCSAGRRVGVAFQLRDDLNDVFAAPRWTGKPCGGDIREGKPTSLVALARMRAEATGDRHALAVLRDALGDAGLTEADLDRVREVLTRTGARATVEDWIARLVTRGLRDLDGARLAPEPGARLRRLLTAAADRTAHEAHEPPGGPHHAPDAAGSPHPDPTGHFPTGADAIERPHPDPTSDTTHGPHPRPRPRPRPEAPCDDGDHPHPQALSDGTDHAHPQAPPDGTGRHPRPGPGPAVSSCPSPSGGKETGR
ncbi:polyprenyl synthetase family protein [Streptomyces sp. NPDC013455]|uniref:polyprenyl synthetase family protein n=1 Tax=Streptomyces sp. NPDC013455 TaxID=3155605 RepID=UPI0033E31383